MLAILRESCRPLNGRARFYNYKNDYDSIPAQNQKQK